MYLQTSITYLWTGITYRTCSRASLQIGYEVFRSSSLHRLKKNSDGLSVLQSVVQQQIGILETSRHSKNTEKEGEGYAMHPTYTLNVSCQVI